MNMDPLLWTLTTESRGLLDTTPGAGLSAIDDLLSSTAHFAEIQSQNAAADIPKRPIRTKILSPSSGLTHLPKCFTGGEHAI